METMKCDNQGPIESPTRTLIAGDYVIPEGFSAEINIEGRIVVVRQKESEDERIRKALIQFLRDYPHLPNGKYSRSDFFAWLEKQKEQQPVPALDRGDEIILKAICEELKYAPGWVERIEGWYSLAKDAQQHAEWSEEDEKIRSAILLMMKVPRKEIFEARGITKEQVLDWLERQKKTEGDHFAKSGHGCQATAPPWDPETEHQCDCEHVGCHINNCRRWCRRYMAEIPYTNCGPACSGYSHKNTGGISVKKPTWTGNDSMALVSLKAIINNSNHNEARKKELLDWIDGRLGPQDGELMWLFAKAGTKFPADALVFGTGEDKDPRIVRCAVNDCYYLVVSDILPPKSVTDKLRPQYGESHGEPAPGERKSDQ